MWKQAALLLREGRAGCELCAAVAVLTQLICCVCGVVTGSTRATPYAAAGALLATAVDVSLLRRPFGIYLLLAAASLLLQAKKPGKT